MKNGSEGSRTREHPGGCQKPPEEKGGMWVEVEAVGSMEENRYN